MQYWLMKSEPNVWSIDQQIKAGEKGADWDGVRNYQAASNLKKMERYHLSNHMNTINIRKPCYYDKNENLIGKGKAKILYQNQIINSELIIYNKVSKKLIIPKNFTYKDTRQIAIVLGGATFSHLSQRCYYIYRLRLRSSFTMVVLYMSI